MEDHYIVRLALRRGMITKDQLEEARQEKSSLSDRGIDRSLLFILEDLNYLSHLDLGRLRASTSSDRVRAMEVAGYLFEGRIGSGGMGDVYRGRTAEGRTAAIKLMPLAHSSDPEYAKRFRREMRLLEKIQHPHITQFYECGSMDERLYLIMEEVEGESLKARLSEKGPMTPAEVVLLMQQIASALAYAWNTHRIVHRDVKPSNIIIGPPRRGVNEPFCVKLCDFGLAKRVTPNDEPETALLTKSGMAVGTPHYMSPELATGSQIIEPLVDIYSLGATAYHGLTGKTLYTGATSEVIMRKHVSDIVNLRTIGIEHAPEKLRQLLVDMLAKDRAERICQWEVVIDRLDELPSLRDRHLATEPSIADESSGGMKKLLVSIAACIIILTSIAVFMLFQSGGGTRIIVTQPATFQMHLQQAEAVLHDGGDIEIQLESGVYAGPWYFTRRHSGLNIRATSSDVVVATGPEESSPVIYIDKDVKDFHLRSVRINGLSEHGLHIGKDSEVFLTGVTIERARSWAMRVVGAHVTAKGLRIHNCDGGIYATHEARVDVSDSVIHTAAESFHNKQSQVSIERVRLYSNNTAKNGEEVPILSQEAGALMLNTVWLSAKDGRIGIVANEVDCDWQRILVEGVHTGIRLQKSSLKRLVESTILAKKVGLNWTGTWDGKWFWSAQRIDAPTALLGSDITGLSTNGTGMNESYLSSIPLLTK